MAVFRLLQFNSESGIGICWAGAMGPFMKSSIAKRSIIIDGRKTSVSLEDAFWSDLKKIADAQQGTLSGLVAEIDRTRKHSNLSSAIRLFVSNTSAMRASK